MKKTLKTTVVMLAVLILICANVLTASAVSPASADIYVSFSNDKGELVLTQEKITVTDFDNDGQLTINDAFTAMHEAKFDGGAAAGYETIDTLSGLFITKLWGIANGGSYGYYLNNNSAWSLKDTVKEGDYLNAFVYTDLTNWSDAYCYFDVNEKTAETGEEIELTLSISGYDATYSPVTLPAKGATITLNGEKTEFKTDDDGKVKISVKKPGNYTVSAVSDAQILVPPVLTLSATGEDLTKSPKTGDSTDIFVLVLMGFVSVSCAAVLSLNKEKAR